MTTVSSLLLAGDLFWLDDDSLPLLVLEVLVEDGGGWSVFISAYCSLPKQFPMISRVVVFLPYKICLHNSG